MPRGYKAKLIAVVVTGYSLVLFHRNRYLMGRLKGGKQYIMFYGFDRVKLYLNKHKIDKTGQNKYEIRKEMTNMTKKYNKGSRNQNAPQLHGQTPISGDNSKGVKRNKDQRSKTDE
ncbi:hypothetical protein P4U44_00340 [Alkalihalobacillus alcalophilus]|nr:hypothetical protein [Alkalihalobacillus alcalophilus]MED1560364.1 hypothetical protein [Alkalihalobacillus alcalophilus]